MAAQSLDLAQRESGRESEFHLVFYALSYFASCKLGLDRQPYPFRNRNIGAEVLLVEIGWEC
ncbi:hypothetical protein F8388_012195 [Cannabis sativa]|uniref:Uncharacterized protein n=1 Tax=Cannabis sativa TaxID=3483 RepID=A0A7J6EVE5_CANSA|nr:hypothetical protein F8388_012195 [Cannabis sativa]